MTKVIKLEATLRAEAGKGNARQTRRDGRIPAVIYGDKQPPATISLDRSNFIQTVKNGGFFSSLIDISIGEKAERCLPRDIQLDPVTDVPLHVDFLRVSANSRIRVGVPVEFINHASAPGIKGGGVLNIICHTIDLECAASKIPEKITVDLTGLEVGDSIHLEAIKLPEGTKPLLAKDATVATIVAPSALKAEELAAAAPAAAVPGAAPAPAAGAAAPAAPGTATPPAAGATKPAGGTPAK